MGEAKNYLWAAKGSYWIYRNTKTGDLDTQTVTYCKTYWNNVKGTTKATRQRNVDYEVLSRGIYSSFNQWTYEDKTHQVVPDDIYFSGTYRVILDRLVASQNVNTPFFMPFAKGAYSGYTLCSNTDTTISIGSINYEKVKVFTIDMDFIWEPKLSCIRPNTYYYWVKDIGLVKKKMNRCNYSWELIDYKILQ
ncbi:MAG: hypothetical protein JNM67_04975 [Bacteroidetes bacterium]|nr:hypothetical protein [Bacteroidota bacterium]